MSSSDIALVLRWIVPLWLLGWAVFPVSRRLFSFLPDEGLAVGRVLALVAASLAAFELASLHLMPLSLGACILPVLAVVCARGWRDAEPKLALRSSKAALILSDLVFLMAFAFFVWVRLRHPSINDLEKPMDLALLNQSARASLLPFENFWFAGTQFTNYYYFGPFMGGMLARLLATPATFAYNLVQPLFCALFLSVLWSLGAALSKSKWLGLGVMALVGLGGHLEPLRQLQEGTPVGQLDWFATSRVIERVKDPSGAGTIYHTINEYPAFTLLIGDAHAHFYAFALALAHFCLCLGVVCVEEKRQKMVLIALGGAVLGVLALTNTWDAPFYGILWAACVFYAARRDENRRGVLRAALAGIVLALAIVLPFFARFRSQIGGGHLSLWLPDARGFALFWGVWIALGALSFGFGMGAVAPSRIGNFRALLLLVGLAALAFPSVYYLGGIFSDTDFRHQDTVFKFYLQAWLLGGTAIASEFLLRLRAATRGRALQIPVAAGALALLWVLSLAPYATWKARTQGYGEANLSLDGAQWLSQSDHKAIEWLRDQSGIVAEQMPPDRGGDYDASRGAIATHSGLPSLLCWPQHVRGWGFQNDATRAAMHSVRSTGSAPQFAQTDAVNSQVDGRITDLSAIFGPDANARRALVAKYGVSFLVIRPNEAPLIDPNFEPHEFDGDDGSKTFVLVRRGF